MKYLLKSRIGIDNIEAELEDSWLGLKGLSSLEVRHNPLLEPYDDVIFEKHPGLFEANILRRPEYLAYFAMLALEIELPPIQQVLLSQIWNHSFPLLCFGRGCGKSSILALYSLIRCILIPGTKIVLAGAAFRQSKAIFTYAETLWKQSPVIRSMVKQPRISHGLDMWEFHLDESVIMAIPIGPNGDKVRGLRASCIIADEIASHDPQILEEVIFGFGSVKANPMESYKLAARKTRIQELGMTLDILGGASEPISADENQAIIAGTASYHFNHYYDYWTKYCHIIKERGNPETLKGYGIKFEEQSDYKKYMVARIPWSMMMAPGFDGQKSHGGFMSEGIIKRQKGQMSESLFNKEYEAIFIADSDGFFKRSTIEACVASPENISSGKIPDYCQQPFDVQIKGTPGKRYVMGIDPARMNDNFAIIVLELGENHSRIVYGWTTNEEDYTKRKMAGSTHEGSYNAFCARHVRILLESFDCEIIAVDAQGGGRGLTDALKNPDLLKEGEVPILATIDRKKPKDTDTVPGRHIIEHINYGAYAWIEPANYELLADLETRTLLFPNYDVLTAELSIIEDKRRAKLIKKDNPSLRTEDLILFDSLEDIAEEIEELKDELTNVIAAQSSDKVGGRLVWKVPDVRLDGQTTSSGKKDRYSALLMANWVAKRILEKPPAQEYRYEGGLAYKISSNPGERRGPMYNSPYYTDDFMEGFGLVTN